MGIPISGRTRLAAVIGSPVQHSLSPAIHNAAFDTGGLDWRFLAFDVPLGGAAAAVAAMKTLGIAGYAVTMPHKTDMIGAVDELDAVAGALRSVNTVALRADGSTLGTSTDGDGFVDSLRAQSVEVVGARVVVLGAGGAARSIIDALGRAGVEDLAIVNRTVEAAFDAARLAPMGRVGSTADIANATLLVNATSVGMASDDYPVDTDLLHAGLAVADIVYHPLDTRLLRAARAASARSIDGLGMLVHQAARQQVLWTGVAPDVGVMRAAAEAELAVRAGSSR